MMPIAADRPITVTLQAQQWNVMLGALADVPWRIADPVIRELTRQLEAGAADATALPAKPNGAEPPPNMFPTP